jgi:F-type H+-transporting ATPase subunit delta
LKSLSVAKRYANALVQVAQKKEALEDFYQQLLKIEECFKGSPDLKIAITSPVLSPSQKKTLMVSFLNRLGVADEIAYFFQVLIDHDRVGYITHIILIYRDMADALLNRIRVDLKSAFPLGNKKEQLKKVLEKKLNKQVLIEEKTDPSLLGGMVLKIQDKVFDISLRRELEKLKESISYQPVL